MLSGFNVEGHLEEKCVGNSPGRTSYNFGGLLQAAAAGFTYRTS